MFIPFCCQNYLLNYDSDPRGGTVCHLGIIMYSSGPLTYDNASFVHGLRTTDLRLISILFSDVHKSSSC